MFGGLAKSLFGSSNDRYVKSLADDRQDRRVRA